VFKQVVLQQATPGFAQVPSSSAMQAMEQYWLPS
jgi:hypothetical protein